MDVINLLSVDAEDVDNAIVELCLKPDGTETTISVDKMRDFMAFLRGQSWSYTDQWNQEVAEMIRGYYKTWKADQQPNPARAENGE